MFVHFGLYRPYSPPAWMGWRTGWVVVVRCVGIAYGRICVKQFGVMLNHVIITPALNIYLNTEQLFKFVTITQMVNNYSNYEQLLKSWTIIQTVNNYSNSEYLLKYCLITERLHNYSNFE